MQFMGKQFGFGNAVLTKHPIIKTRTYPITGEFKVYENLEDYQENTRNLQEVQVKVLSGELFTVFNHHGYWDRSPLGNEQSVEALQKVSTIVTSTNGPVIFAGDLNVIAESPAMQAFSGLLEDLTDTHKLTTTLSELGKVQDVPCDHIMVTNDVTVLNYTASPRLVSDHMPIVLEFEIAHL